MNTILKKLAVVAILGAALSAGSTAQAATDLTVPSRPQPVDCPAYTDDTDDISASSNYGCDGGWMHSVYNYYVNQ
ncbi:hypothetical protein ACQKM2_39570 [Streptomyces sp. NPDC004126]|uniref:hypothetical protein n=1 Tax=Streptomyces sp. NPDC004126 TaxID=3390695 RepID=UPI003D03317F